MYDHSTVVIALILFLSLLAATEMAFRIGRRFVEVTPESTKSQISAIQGSILGVLALLLGFTFSLSLQRYDTRSQAVISEANAIGTAMLRTELLPADMRSGMAERMQRYLELRILGSSISLDHVDERRAVLLQSNEVTHEMWRLAAQAAEENPNPVTTGLFIQSLNEVIDSYGSRDAALNRHVPEAVLFLLFGTLILTASLVGYSSGVAGHRASFPTYILFMLIVLMVFIVIDLDRPRRGLIEVSQQSMLDLQAATAVERQRN